VIYTAGTQTYAEPILNAIDPDNQFFAARLYRHHCVKCGRFFLKDLRFITQPLGLSADKIILVDNSLVSFALNMDNGISIPDFYGYAEQDDDKELIYCAQYIEDLFETEGGVRSKLKSDFKIRLLVQHYK
jgi:TFIIF-interacting CTD phosphatase-like protein